MKPGDDVPPSILVFTGFFLPGFKGGGPIRTLANLVDQLGEEFRFRIVTSDRDLGDDAPYPDTPVDRWVRAGKADVFYGSPGVSGWRALLKTHQVRAPDLVYLNSFFSPFHSILPMIHRRCGGFGKAPVLLAPRGEFSSGALAIKPTKKRAFLMASRAFGLHADVTFQASSEHEAEDIRRVFFTSSTRLGSNVEPRRRAERIAIARNLTGSSSHSLPRERRADSIPLRLVFLARIAPIKNLLGALDILSRVGSVPVTFDIYGLVEDRAYWARCEAAIAKLPPSIGVHYRGALMPDQVEATLSRYDVLLFPTLGENYGHVIREALSAGLPVLISDRTPWRGLEAKGVGADLPLDDLDRFADRIRAWAALPPERFRAMRLAARALGDDPIAAQAAVEANRRMFISALRAAG